MHNPAEFTRNKMFYWVVFKWKGDKNKQIIFVVVFFCPHWKKPWASDDSFDVFHNIFWEASLRPAGVSDSTVCYYLGMKMINEADM